jgi:hypothetical protein
MTAEERSAGVGAIRLRLGMHCLREDIEVETEFEINGRA